MPFSRKVVYRYGQSTIREQLEEREVEYLSPYAVLSRNSRGRQREEPQCDIRPVFQRDRDRILHCKAFRRLKQKTQVFLPPKGDHYRTRLTHTLEVSQNARTIAKALRLNEDLVEAIALGHDLGHTPFRTCRRAGPESMYIISHIRSRACGWWSALEKAGSGPEPDLGGAGRYPESSDCGHAPTRWKGRW